MFDKCIMRRFSTIIMGFVVASGVLWASAQEAEKPDPLIPPVVTPGVHGTPDRAGTPPSDAVVLFDGENFDHWESSKGGDVQWKLVDGAMEVVEARLSPSEKERSRALTDLLRGSEALRDSLQRVGAQEQMLTNAVEEMMRWTAPGSVIPLTTQVDLSFPSPCDTTMGGRLIKKGEVIHFPKSTGVTVDVRAANRGRANGRELGAGGCPFGEGVLAEKRGDFDVSREAQIPAKGHLSFGSGAHVCLGANLAVENSKRMLEAILRRCPDLEISGVPEETDTTLFMGFNSFPVRSRALTQV